MEAGTRCKDDTGVIHLRGSDRPDHPKAERIYADSYNSKHHHSSIISSIHWVARLFKEIVWTMFVRDNRFSDLTIQKWPGINSQWYEAFSFSIERLMRMVPFANSADNLNYRNNIV